MKGLRDAYLVCFGRNSLLERELKTISLHVKNRGLSVIPLKGPSLARFLYKDIALRQGGEDIDLLVRYDDALSLCNALAGMGYVFKPDELRLPYRRQVTLVRRPDQERAGMYLDLHWDFRDRFMKTHVDQFLHHAKEVNIGDYRILMPSSSDLLLYLALTAITDFDFVQVKYLYDMHTLIATHGTDIDWEAVTVSARRVGLSTVLYFSLYCAADLFATEIPRHVLQGLKPPFIKRNVLKAWIQRDVILRKREAVAVSITWRTFISSYLLSATLFDCAKIILKKIFVPLDEVTRSYGEMPYWRACCMYAKRLMKPLAKAWKLNQEESRG